MLLAGDIRFGFTYARVSATMRVPIVFEPRAGSRVKNELRATGTRCEPTLAALKAGQPFMAASQRRDAIGCSLGRPWAGSIQTRLAARPAASGSLNST